MHLFEDICHFCLSYFIFFQVEEMIKELDALLECIEEAGGFRDACTVLHRSSVLELEEDVEALFDRCRLWKVSSLDLFIRFYRPHHCRVRHTYFVLSIGHLSL